MTATATHDTKRGEDARARLLVLAELPHAWTEQVERWTALNAPHARTSAGKRAPSHAHEYMLYQALLGAWPLAGVDESFIERMTAYAIKAAREGKLETSWTNPDERYETGLTDFVRALLDPSRSAEFLSSFAAFAAPISLFGAINGLVQLTLKATMPGVPDFYQGAEFWDLSLVDPDNRRPVDYAARARALDETADWPDWPSLAAAWRDGRIKLALMHRLLDLRVRKADLFPRGGYRGLPVSGADAERVIAFVRTDGRSTVAVVAGRRFARGASAAAWPCFAEWDGEVDFGSLGRLRSALHPGGEVHGAAALRDLFGILPVAVFESEAAAAARRRHRVHAVPA